MAPRSVEVGGAKTTGRADTQGGYVIDVSAGAAVVHVGTKAVKTILAAGMITPLDPAYDVPGWIVHVVYPDGTPVSEARVTAWLGSPGVQAAANASQEELGQGYHVFTYSPGDVSGVAMRVADASARHDGCRVAGSPRESGCFYVPGTMTRNPRSSPVVVGSSGRRCVAVGR
jgi:hypothetical protein